MSKFGPTRGELLFRLGFSLAGLAFAAVALFYRGPPSGPAFFEIGIIAGGFFAGTAVYSAWKLYLREDQ
jgi:hypothetical protein